MNTQICSGHNKLHPIAYFCRAQELQIGFCIFKQLFLKNKMIFSRDHMWHAKPKIFDTWPFREKSLLIFYIYHFLGSKPISLYQILEKKSLPPHPQMVKNHWTERSFSIFDILINVFSTLCCKVIKKEP